MASNGSPQSNLKDRIAALQRLNQQNNNGASANPNLAPPAGASGAQASPSRVSLRDKIAKFEQRGGTPIPRGSFGMGAPPSEDASLKKKGELIGNRVPGLNKPTSDRSAPPSAAVRSFNRQRHTSTSDLDFSPPETPSEFGSKSRSPTLPATVSGRVGMLEAVSAGAVDSFPDSGFVSATSSPRRNSLAAGRRSVSDSYGPYGLSSPPATENSTAVESSKDVVIQAANQLTSEPESLDPLPVAQPVASPVVDPVKETTPMQDAEVELKIEVPPLEEEVQSSPLPPQTSPPPTPDSLETRNLTIPLTSTTVNSAGSGDDNIALNPSLAETIESRSPPSQAVLVPAPFSSSPPQKNANPAPDAVTSSSAAPSGSPDPKPIGESQPKLRKKVYPNVGPGFQEPSMTPKAPSRKSFTAVVHKRDTDLVTAAPPALPPTPARLRMPAADTALPPASPVSGDLAWLVAEAAMLEKALGMDSSSNDEFSEPDYSVPLFTRPKAAAQPSTPPVPELVRDDASSEQTDPTPSTHSPYPVPTVREVGEEEGEDEFDPVTPAKSTRSRKLSSKIKALASGSSSTLRSLSSSHSRPSMSSEMSSEDSTRGRRSPQPSEDGGSLSSSRWSPSPKKNPLARATSFADRIMNRSSKSKSAYLDDSTDYVHLSPSRASTVSIPRPKKSTDKSRSLSSHSAPRLNLPDFSSTAGPPTSSPQEDHSSTASTPSGLIDSELFDAFPSVPQGLPSLLPSSNSASTLSLHSKSYNNRSSSATIRNP